MLAIWALTLGLGLTPLPRSRPLAPLSSDPEDPPVSIRTDRESPYRRGDAVRVSVSTRRDGYLTVLRTDTDGGIQVLFPREPWADGRVRGGRVLEVEEGAESSAFSVDDNPGVGYLFAVVSAEPFDYSRIIRRNRWDYRGIAGGRIHGDPYVALTGIAEAITPVGTYAYDIAPYYVERQYDYPRFICYDCHTYQAYSAWDPYRAACAHYRIVIFDDPYYYPYRAYGPHAVVPARPARLGPRYVFENADGRTDFVTRARRTDAQANPPWRLREPAAAPAPQPSAEAPRRRDIAPAPAAASQTAGEPALHRRRAESEKARPNDDREPESPHQP